MPPLCLLVCVGFGGLVGVGVVGVLYLVIEGVVFGRERVGGVGSLLGELEFVGTVGG